jgi:hypothetical protein
LEIAYDSKRVTLVQQFEGNYIEYTQPSTLNGNTLTVQGRLSEGRLESIHICFDESSIPLTSDELETRMNGSYSLGEHEIFDVYSLWIDILRCVLYSTVIPLNEE